VTAIRSATAGTTVRRRTRAVVVCAATLAPAAIWLLARAAGADLVVDLGNGQPPMTIGLAIVLAFAGQAAILGWFALALLERFTTRARAIWTGLAVGVLLISFIPLAAAEADAWTKLGLSLMHLAVAAVLVPLLPRGRR
jgi:hypothetical protein